MAPTNPNMMETLGISIETPTMMKNGTKVIKRCKGTEYLTPLNSNVLTPNLPIKCRIGKQQIATTMAQSLPAIAPILFVGKFIKISSLISLPNNKYLFAKISEKLLIIKNPKENELRTQLFQRKCKR